MEEVEIQCPFCWENFTVSLAAEDGEEQVFVYDCEVCCNPINVTAQFQEDIWSVTSEKGEGFN